MEYNSVREIHRRRKNRAAAPIGALVLVLALVGVVAIIIAGTNLTGDLLDHSREKEKYEKIVQPVLMFDPPPFDDITTLTNKSLLESALWATMLGEKRETYTFDAQSNLIVPSSDVDVTSAKLFGAGVKLDHQSFASDFGISYDFDVSRNAYLVPVMSATALYTPRVDEITRSGDIYSLLVGYIPPGTAWNTDLSGAHTEPDPHKFMIYKLKKIDNYFQIIAIEDPPPEKQVNYANSIILDGGIADVQEASLPDEGAGEAEASPEGGGPADGTVSAPEPVLSGEESSVASTQE